MKSELRALTGARGIAAWWVVLYHIRLSVAGLPPLALALFRKGYLAVDFFFLLSGFVIALAWSERLRDDGWRAVPEFLAKRVARVWPLHGFMLACAVLLVLAMTAAGRETAGMFPWRALPAHLLLVQNWGGTARLSWNVPAWSISAEAVAYLLFPALTLAIDWRRVPSLGVVAAIAAMLVILAGGMIGAGADSLGWHLERFGVLRCLCEFGAGTAICALWRRWRAAWRGPALASLAVAAVCLGAWAAGLHEAIAVPPAFAALLLALALTAGKRGNPLEGRLLHGLGEISYATYLGHWLLFFAFKLALVSDEHAIPPVLVGLYLLLVLGSSVALYALVEKPGQRLFLILLKSSPSLSREGGPLARRVADGDSSCPAAPRRPVHQPAAGPPPRASSRRT